MFVLSIGTAYRVTSPQSSLSSKKIVFLEAFNAFWCDLNHPISGSLFFSSFGGCIPIRNNIRGYIDVHPLESNPLSGRFFVREERTHRMCLNVWVISQHGFRGHESKRAGFIAASDARQVSSRHREAEIPRLVPKSSELIIRKLTAIPSA